MIDARHYLASETLRNGLEIRIRALRPDDGERIVECEPRGTNVSARVPRQGSARSNDSTASSRWVAN